MKQDKTIRAISSMILIFVGISGCFSVLFGAWLAHKGVSLPQEIQTRLATALQYQFLHSLVLLITMVWFMVKPTLWLLVSAGFILTGIVLFSGSLYIKTFFDFAIVAKSTPFGGISFALGWLCISVAGIRNIDPLLGSCSGNKKI